MNKSFKWHMLITSFLPLWFSILIIDSWNLICYGKDIWNNDVNYFSNIFNIFVNNITIIIFMLIVIINMIVSVSVINKFINLQNKNADKYNKAKLQNAKSCSNLSPEFLIAYILPMLVFNFVSTLHIVLFILYFSMLAFLSIRNNHVYVNILLEFKKYKIYTADVVHNKMGQEKEFKECIILSKNDICSMNDGEFLFYDFENKIYLDLTKENLDDITGDK